MLRRAAAMYTQRRTASVDAERSPRPAAERRDAARRRPRGRIDCFRRCNAARPRCSAGCDSWMHWCGCGPNPLGSAGRGLGADGSARARRGRCRSPAGRWRMRNADRIGSARTNARMRKGTRARTCSHVCVRPRANTDANLQTRARAHPHAHANAHAHAHTCSHPYAVHTRFSHKQRRDAAGVRRRQGRDTILWRAAQAPALPASRS